MTGLDLLSRGTMMSFTGVGRSASRRTPVSRAINSRGNSVNRDSKRRARSFIDAQIAVPVLRSCRSAVPLGCALEKVRRLLFAQSKLGGRSFELVGVAFLR